jgi:hypothetical protein
MRTLRFSVRGSDGEVRGFSAYGSRGESFLSFPGEMRRGLGKLALNLSRSPLPRSFRRSPKNVCAADGSNKIALDFVDIEFPV